MKTNPKMTVLETLVYKTELEIIKSIIFTRFNFIPKPCSPFREYRFIIKLKRKDFRFCYFWLYFVYQNFQNGYFRISLRTIFFVIPTFTICIDRQKYTKHFLSAVMSMFILFAWITVTRNINLILLLVISKCFMFP